MGIIDTSELENGGKGLSRGFANFMLECAIFCFHSNRHISGVKLLVRTNSDQADYYTVVWKEIDIDSLVSSMYDKNRTTDFGAMYISLLLATTVTKYNFFITTSAGKRFDYYLFTEKPKTLDLTKAEAKLEISGIRKETINNTIRKRLLEKRSQLRKSKIICDRSYISIIEFNKPESVFECQ